MSEQLTNTPPNPEQALTPEMESAAQVERIAEKIGYFGLQGVDIKPRLFKDTDIVGINREMFLTNTMGTNFTHDVIPSKIGGSDETEKHIKLSLDSTRKPRKGRTYNVTTPNSITSLSGETTDGDGNTRELTHQESRDAAAEILWKASRRKAQEKRGENTQEEKLSNRKIIREAKESDKRNPSPGLSGDEKARIAGAVIGGVKGYAAVRVAQHLRDDK